jgi:hypothetical protein
VSFFATLALVRGEDGATMSHLFMSMSMSITKELIKTRVGFTPAFSCGDHGC